MEGGLGNFYSQKGGLHGSSSSAFEDYSGGWDWKSNPRETFIGAFAIYTLVLLMWGVYIFNTQKEKAKFLFGIAVVNICFGLFFYNYIWKSLTNATGW